MLKELQNRMEKENVELLIINKLVNIRYLTGFTGSTANLVVSQEGGYILVDPRYWEQANKEVLEFQPVLVNEDLNFYSFCKELVKKQRVKKIGFEGNHISYFEWIKLQDIDSDIELVPTENWVEEFRVVKNSDEISKIKKALEIAEKAFEEILEFIRPEVSEKDLAIELEYKMAKLGSEKPSFDTIIASGERSALPHGKATNKRIKKGEFIVFDFGAIYEGYCSDITRTVFVGTPNEEELLIYDIVLKAQKEAEEIIKEGLEGSFVDGISRDIIQENGFGNYFGHGLGHGVGLEIHEFPPLSPKGNIILKENMVVTIEPGIYLYGKFGVRIEDLVVVGKERSTVLNSFTNDLITI
ncbi:MAG TPA: aminopeptidase P family protein [Dictyoglomaceae bacterium]|nr:aminopeptidase P family protein [Dictyoglomaceae bacterium]HOL38782.1 aminopeptidase P family protein [Dictyoglomaceae bacterium]HPP15469.1 aminopeptidase P family protein [Dictyoglomaceae bacterium]